MDTKAMGMELRENNDKIVECILLLKEQRDELAYIIEKQQEERKKLETEMERITYKLCLINKSLAQRIKAKSSYDNTLNEIENNYAKLVKDSGDLLGLIKKEFENLESLINKKTSTEDQPNYDNVPQQNGSGEQIFTGNPSSGGQAVGQQLQQICKCQFKPVKEPKKDLSDKANQSQGESEIPTKLNEAEWKKDVASIITTSTTNESIHSHKKVTMPVESFN